MIVGTMRNERAMRETIVAPATAPGQSAMAVLRISGPRSGELLRALTGGMSCPARALRLAALRGRDGEIIDEAIVIAYEAPRSYTGEDMAEIMCHGSPAVIRELISASVELGARPAQPGEFTLRALEAGKVDLAQAEAIQDLVGAATIEQARIAARQLRGEVSRALDPIANAAFDLLADIESGLDFAEEEGPVSSAERLALRCASIVEDLEELLQRSEVAQRVKEGARVVLIGPPNAGKSSLFNALVGYSRAIVTPEAGTTRDLVEETIVLEGLPVVLIDAAGLGAAEGLAEIEGMRRAREAAAGAQLVLEVFHLAEAPVSEPLLDGAQTLRVGTHRDLITSPVPEEVIAVDSLRGAGIPELRRKISTMLGAPGTTAVESVALATERHRLQAAVAREALGRASTLLGAGRDAELAAVEVRAAVGALREILGAVGPEELLGRIFSRFCIGK